MTVTHRETWIEHWDARTRGKLALCGVPRRNRGCPLLRFVPRGARDVVRLLLDWLPSFPESGCGIRLGEVGSVDETGQDARLGTFKCAELLTGAVRKRDPGFRAVR